MSPVKTDLQLESILEQSETTTHVSDLQALLKNICYLCNDAVIQCGHWATPDGKHKVLFHAITKIQYLAQEGLLT